MSHNSQLTRFSLRRLSLFPFQLSRKLPLAHRSSQLNAGASSVDFEPVDLPAPAIWLLRLPWGQNSWEASAHEPSRCSRFGGPGFNMCPPFPVTILRPVQWSWSPWSGWVLGMKNTQTAHLLMAVPDSVFGILTSLPGSMTHNWLSLLCLVLGFPLPRAYEQMHAPSPCSSDTCCLVSSPCSAAMNCSRQ